MASAAKLRDSVAFKMKLKIPIIPLFSNRPPIFRRTISSFSK